MRFAQDEESERKNNVTSSFWSRLEQQIQERGRTNERTNEHEERKLGDVVGPNTRWELSLCNTVRRVQIPRPQYIVFAWRSASRLLKSVCGARLRGRYTREGGKHEKERWWGRCIIGVEVELVRKGSKYVGELTWHDGHFLGLELSAPPTFPI